MTLKTFITPRSLAAYFIRDQKSASQQAVGASLNLPHYIDTQTAICRHLSDAAEPWMPDENHMRKRILPRLNFELRAVKNIPVALRFGPSRLWKRRGI